MSTSVREQVPTRPFLKWAGGKKRLIRQYQPYFPEFKNYYEPFLGGGAVFFHLRPQSAVLTDINTELINAYCCVRNRVEELIGLLEEHQTNHKKNGKEYYYDMRSQTPNTEIERAARFIYLNRTCFNGLYRENSQGEFNVPIGKYQNPQICNRELLCSASAALQNVTIEDKSFEYVLDYALSSDDFVYFDPPYHPVSSTSYFTAYSRYSFSEDDQKNLRDIFVKLAGRGVKVMLSNSDCDFIRDLYSQFNFYEISAARAINSKIEKRGSIAEVLITSYELAA